MSSRNPEYFISRPVESMQYMLRVLSQGDPRLHPITPDGIFGQNTMAAVLAFQRAYGLPTTGVMNLATWERLVEAYEMESLLQNPAEALQPILNPRQILVPGESNYHVYLVQAILETLACAYDGMPKVHMTGVMDAATVAAVRRFQTLSGLPVTGAVDRQTWRQLALQYALAAQNGSRKHCMDS